MNEGNSFKATDFIGIGVASTRHGYTILDFVLRCGQQVKCGIVFTDDQQKLELSRPFMADEHWWNVPGLLKQQKACLKSSFCEYSVERLYLKYNIPFIYVPDFGDPAARLAAATGAQAALLLEAPIIRGKILSALPQGIVNFHAAPLPEYRGNYATYWALYHNEPLFLTAHLVRHGVDNGPILLRRPIPVYAGDTLRDIDLRAIEVAAAVALEVMEKSQEGIALIPQEPWQGRLFKGAMPEDIIKECERRLQAGEYGFYVERP